MRSSRFRLQRLVSDQQKFTYVRYDMPLRSPQDAPEVLPSLDNLERIQWLIDQGKKCAADEVMTKHGIPEGGGEARELRTNLGS